MSARGERFLQLVLAFGFIAVSAGVYGSCAAVHTLRCERRTGACEVESRTAFKTDLTSLKISEIKEARVVGSRSRSGSSSHVALETTRGNVKLVKGLGADTDPGLMEWQVQQINTFLQDSRKETLDVSQESMLLPRIVGGAFMLLGVVFLLSGLFGMLEGQTADVI